MDKPTAVIMIVAIISLSVIAIMCNFGGEAIAAIAGLVTGGGAGYVAGRGD